jgi:hypothetical protein
MIGDYLLRTRLFTVTQGIDMSDKEKGELKPILIGQPAPELSSFHSLTLFLFEAWRQILLPKNLQNK